MKKELYMSTKPRREQNFDILNGIRTSRLVVDGKEIIGRSCYQPLDEIFDVDDGQGRFKKYNTGHNDSSHIWVERQSKRQRRDINEKNELLSEHIACRDICAWK
ncbi:hypothetical protein AC1031_018050 [Aphanomyces cochlioides]|nr:hypothetical protein AC1031_018050 [Aphanomyces cochlioides]